MSLPPSTLFWLVAPPVVLVGLVLIWSLSRWDRER
jgi:hypothetical protein